MTESNVLMLKKSSQGSLHMEYRCSTPLCERIYVCVHMCVYVLVHVGVCPAEMKVYGI